MIAKKNTFKPIFSRKASSYAQKKHVLVATIFLLGAFNASKYAWLAQDYYHNNNANELVKRGKTLLVKITRRNEFKYTFLENLVFYKNTYIHTYVYTQCQDQTTTRL
jgi:hypothetical protein